MRKVDKKFSLRIVAAAIFIFQWSAAGFASDGVVFAWGDHIQKDHLGIENPDIADPHSSGAIIQMDPEEEARFFEELDAYFDGQFDEPWVYEVDDEEASYLVEDATDEPEVVIDSDIET